uniref:UDP-glucuronosyltransferase n=1 Tax=Rhabditophanes sp. KR3021 TaxID=114890 RepID=A0AC35TVL0_9BILA
MKVVGILFGPSHLSTLGASADLLVKAGHEVTFLLSPVEAGTTSVGTKLAKLIQLDKNPFLANLPVSRKQIQEQIWTLDYNNDPSAIYSSYKHFKMLMQGNCEHLIINATLTEYIKKQKFDLGVFEPFFYCSVGMIKKWGIPAHVSLATSGLISSRYSLLGLTYPVASLPDFRLVASDEEMGFFNRLTNLYSFVITKTYSDGLLDAENAVFDKHFGKGDVDLREEFRQSSFVFINSDPFVDYAHPLLSKIIPLGGFSIEKPQKLKGKWDEILSLRTRNVLIAFGTNALSTGMPLANKLSIISVIRLNPDVTFIWKYESPNEVLVQDIDNLIVSAWLPQKDLLADKRMSAFVSHGGLSSINEGALAGVPMLLIPLFADQGKNAQIVKKLQFGVVLDKFLLKKPEKLNEALNTVIQPHYNQFDLNAKRISAMIASRPTNQTANFIKHVEFAAKFGRLDNLNLEGHDLNIFQYALLDILLFIIVCVVASFGLIGYLGNKVYRYLTKSRKVVVVKKNKKNN